MILEAAIPETTGKFVVTGMSDLSRMRRRKTTTISNMMSIEGRIALHVAFQNCTLLLLRRGEFTSMPVGSHGEKLPPTMSKKKKKKRKNGQAP